MTHGKIARKAMRGCLAITFGALGLVHSSSAQANPLFPAKLKDALMMPCTPECVLCHMTSMGGAGTLKNITNKAGMMVPGFAKNLQTLAPGMLDGGDPTSLAPSIAFVKTLPTMVPPAPLPDSDGDGVDDFTELSRGDDPNDFNPGASICGGGPTYGCGRIAKPGPVDNVGAASAMAVALGLISVMRKRR